MKVISSLSTHALVGILVAILGAGPEFAWGQDSSASETQTTSEARDAASTAAPASAQQDPTGDLPNSPGSLLAQSSAPSSPQSSTSITSEHPSGTAAAEIGNAAGTPASKPAGIAMAPAKQHQSRSLLIKIGALVGVGVAVGTVFALSNASPGRPPGSQ